jgi:hypothetical protein
MVGGSRQVKGGKLAEMKELKRENEVFLGAGPGADVSKIPERDSTRPRSFCFCWFSIFDISAFG